MEVRQTSIDTYRRIESEGLLSDMRWRVYCVLYDHGPATRAEVMKRLEHPGMVRQPDIYNRLSDLRARRVATVVGERECSITHNRCQLWDVTDQLPVKPEGVARPDKETMRNALSDLREVYTFWLDCGASRSPALDALGKWMMKFKENDDS